jgi:site-specific DNA-cytosine methylase
MIETAVFEHPEIEYAACGGTHGIGGIGREQIKKHAPGQMARLGYRAASDFEHLKAIQGLPDDYDLPGFKVSAKCKAVGNGVPYPMARAMARAVLEATATETIGVAS